MILANPGFTLIHEKKTIVCLSFIINFITFFIFILAMSGY